MNILVITFEFPPQPGGIGVYSYQIANHLANLGHDIVVLAYTHNMPDDLVKEFDAQQAFRIYRYEYRHFFFQKFIHRFWLTFSILRKNDFDLNFIPQPRAGMLGLIFKHLFRLPYIMVGHGTEFLEGRRWTKLIMQIIYNRANMVLTNSNYTTKLARRIGIKKHLIKMIPLGADDERFDHRNYDPQALKNRNSYTNRKVVLTVGALSPRKGHRFVIDAIDEIKNEIPEVLYIIVGRGEEEENLKEQIKQKNLEHHVQLKGFVPYEKLPEYYAMCDVFILNSTIAANGDVEGFGIVLIEANLLKKPVVGTMDCGIEDAIENQKSGLLVDRDDIQATANALKRLLMNPDEAHQMGEYGYKRAKNNYTWKKVAMKTEDAIRPFSKGD